MKRHGNFVPLPSGGQTRNRNLSQNLSSISLGKFTSKIKHLGKPVP